MNRFFFIFAGASLATLVTSAGALQAAPLSYSGYPDLESSNLSVTYTYNSTTEVGTFSVTGSVYKNSGGWVDKWKERNSASSPLMGDTQYSLGSTFNLNATFTVNSPTSLTIIGGSLTVDGPGGVSTPLFTSTALSQFGFSTATDQWQFLFTTGGGTYGALGNIGVDITGLNATYAAGGTQAGKNYADSTLTLPVDFTESFSTPTPGTGLEAGGLADTFVVVPLPRAAYMGALLPALLLIPRRRRGFRAI